MDVLPIHYTYPKYTLYSPKTPRYVEVPFLHEMGRELRSRAENWFTRLQMTLRVFLGEIITLENPGMSFFRKKSVGARTRRRRAYTSIYPHIYPYMPTIS